MTGEVIAQQNNFVLSSSAFADNGIMAQKYWEKILLTRIASVKTFATAGMAQCHRCYTELRDHHVRPGRQKRFGSQPLGRLWH